MRFANAILTGLGLISAATVVGPSEDRLPPTQFALDRAAAWMKVNDRFGPEGKTERVELQSLAINIAKSNHLNVSYGAMQMRSGRPHRIDIWAGEFFAFRLDDEQARRLSIGPNFASIGASQMPLDRRRTPPALTLDKLSIDHAELLDGSKPITGRVSYRMLQRPKEKIGLRLGFTNNSGTHLYFVYPEVEDLAKDEGVLQFSYEPINTEKNKDDPHSGPLILFVDLCTAWTGRAADMSILGSTAAALVNVADED